jgi:hypothetical protein
MVDTHTNLEQGRLPHEMQIQLKQAKKCKLSAWLYQAEASLPPKLPPLCPVQKRKGHANLNLFTEKNFDLFSMKFPYSSSSSIATFSLQL